MDGLEATRLIKSAKTGVRAKIIAVTAHALEQERREILAAGCDELIRKPYQEPEIFDAMARHLGLKYVYEGETPEISAAAEYRLGELTALPSSLRSQLYQAAIELDTARTLALIEEVGSKNASLGAALEALAKRLDYDGLLRLLESAEATSAGEAA